MTKKRAAPPQNPVIRTAYDVAGNEGRPLSEGEIRTLLAAAHRDELAARRRVDALVAIASHRKLPRHSIAAALGITRQGANVRHKAALRRLAAD